MEPAALLAARRRKPFEAFRLVTQDGRCYDIRHPDRIAVTLTDAIIGFPAPGRLAVWERFDIVGLEHVVRLEQVPKPTGNGAESA